MHKKLQIERLHARVDFVAADAVIPTVEILPRHHRKRHRRDRVRGGRGAEAPGKGRAVFGFHRHRVGGGGLQPGEEEAGGEIRDRGDGFPRAGKRPGSKRPGSVCIIAQSGSAGLRVRMMAMSGAGRYRLESGGAFGAEVAVLATGG